jgi:hypothetical protein
VQAQALGFCLECVRRDVFPALPSDCIRHAPHLAPKSAGPLTLAEIYCQTNGPSHSVTDMLVSPDACLFAYYDLNAVLHLSPLDADRWSDYRADLGTFATFSANIRSARAFAWATNSRFLWTATHDVIRPSGFATSPMRPVQTGENGTFQALPELRHDSGPLDALLWVGSEGLAAAQFGTRGGFYRPGHDDLAPTFALVDARRGLVLFNCASRDTSTTAGLRAPL